MKKLLLFLLFISFHFIIHAQTCTPAWGGGGSKSDGLRPDSVQNLPAATVSVPYSATIQLKVPKDSTYLGQKVAIDSIVLVSFTGFPSTITYGCNPSNCSFPGGDSGCIEISGTPATADIGVHHLKGYILTWIAGGIAVPDSVNDYLIKISSSSGINSINRNYFDVSQNYPNPAASATSIDYYLPVSGNVQFTVYNLLGTVLYQQHYFAKAGANTIPFNTAALANGMYFYTVSNGNTIITRRMTVNR